MALSAGFEGGGAASSGGSLVFEWDGATTDQFDTANPYISGGTLNTLQMSVVPDSTVPGGNLLHMEVAGAGEGYAIFLANDPLPTKSFIIEAEVYGVGTNGQGFAFYAEDSSGLYCYASTGIGASRYWRVDGGTPTTYGSTAVTQIIASTAGFCRFIVRGDKISSGIHRGHTMWDGNYVSFADARVFSRRIQDYPSEPAGASWNALTANRWGLALYGAGGGAAGPLDFAALRIYEL